MDTQRCRQTDGRVHGRMSQALAEAERSLINGYVHICDLVVPLDALTADGHWCCLGCLYEEAWRDGYVAGVRDGYAMPS
jgi:hypothetical protein